ncbi:MAG: PIN domain-containing protein [Chthoniobacterales bacterium]|nr:PIN domain-containing protein [Chthoniobacterales bacterium]
MILPDLNLLLYAYNPFAPQHEAARNWWQSSLRGGEIIGLPHEITLGFVRIATHPRLGNAAVPLASAKNVVLGWLSHPSTRVLLPGEDHAAKVFDLMGRAGASGALTSDASLAVHAIENRATLCTNDADFARFPSLDWRNPLAAGAAER